MEFPKGVNTRWQYTVRTKLALLFSLLIVGISGFILFYFPGQLERDALRAMSDRADGVARMAAFSASAGLDFSDVEAVLDVLESVRQNPDFVYVIVQDESGSTFASIGDLQALHTDRSLTAAIGPGTDLFQTDTPILVSGREIGRLRLGLSLASVTRQVGESRRSVLFLALTILTIGLISVFGISGVIMRPLSEMARTATAISSGDLSQRAAVVRRDEFGVLAGAFNVMVEHVEERTLDLEKEVLERRQAEEALRVSEKRLAYILAASPAVIYTCRLTETGDAKPTFVSKNIREILGYDPEDCLEDSGWWPSGLHPEDFSQTQNELKRMNEDGRLTQEYRFRCADGTYRWIQDSVRTVPDGTGRLVELVGSWVDVTDRKELEFEARAANDALEAQRAGTMRSDRLRSLGEMAAGIAHELNQPLVGVRGLAEHVQISLDRGWEVTDEKLRGRMSRIIEQADRMVHIIDHVRAFAREAGKPDLSEISVNDVVLSSVDMLGAQFRSSGVDLQTDLSEHLPVVLANPFSLEEVVINLLNNARDATLDGRNGFEAKVSVKTYSRQCETGPEVAIDVQDNGGGVPEDIAAKVWDPFFTTKAPDKGTGLGLSISKGIVEEFGGSMALDSRPGCGSSVSIHLPAANRQGDMGIRTQPDVPPGD